MTMTVMTMRVKTMKVMPMTVPPHLLLDPPVPGLRLHLGVLLQSRLDLDHVVLHVADPVLHLFLGKRCCKEEQKEEWTEDDKGQAHGGPEAWRSPS